MFRMVITLTLIFSFIRLAPAMYFEGGGSYTVQPADTVSDDLLYFGRELTVSGTVQSDVYFFGEMLQINGHIGDDVLIFGRRAIIRGEVNGNVFFFGQELKVQGTVHGTIRSMGERIELLPGAVVEGNVISGSKEFRLEGARVTGYLQGGSGIAIFNGTVGRKVNFETESVRFGEQFAAGDSVTITFYKEKPATIPNAPANLIVHVKPARPFYRSPWKIWLGLSALVVGLLIVGLFPGANREMAQLAWQNPVKVGGIGGLFLLIVPVITLLSVVVLPLMFILGSLYLIVLYVGKLLGVSVVGQWMLQRLLQKEHPNGFLAFLLGFIVLNAVTFIPLIGSLVYFVVAFLGVGAMVMVLWRQYRGETASTGEMVQ